MTKKLCSSSTNTGYYVYIQLSQIENYVTKSQQKKLRSIQTILSDSPVKSHQMALLKLNQAHSNLLSTVRELLPESSQLHCLSAQLKHDNLVIHTDSSGWAAKLRFQLTTLLPTLRRQAGYHLATTLSVRVQPPQSSRSAKKLAQSRMDQQTAQQIRELACSIRDENLRQRWLNLANNADSSGQKDNHEK